MFDRHQVNKEEQDGKERKKEAAADPQIWIPLGVPLGYGDKEAVQRSEQKKQAAATILSNHSRFLMACFEEEVRVT